MRGNGKIAQRLRALAIDSGLCPAGRYVPTGSLILVSTGSAGGRVLEQVCPVAVKIGNRDSMSDVAVAEIAQVLAAEATNLPVRAALDRAHKMALLVTA